MHFYELSAMLAENSFHKNLIFFFIIIIVRHYNIISEWAWNERDEFNIQVCPFYIYEFKTSHIVSLRTFHPKR